MYSGILKVIHSGKYVNCILCHNPFLRFIMTVITISITCIIIHIISSCMSALLSAT